MVVLLLVCQDNVAEESLWILVMSMVCELRRFKMIVVGISETNGLEMLRMMMLMTS